MNRPRNPCPADELDREFGFDLDDEAWASSLRTIRDAPALGRIGPYEVLGEGGRGAQGVVYRVRQPRTGRTIALKRIAAGVFATPEMQARFEREVEAIAALDHPNIVALLGSELVDGQPVLAMQWIDGVPFDEWARPPGAAQRPTREVLETFVRACDAVHHAHQRGLIHRDLKPTNILVDAQGQPHVLDFGLAKLREGESAAALRTATGAFVGTPAFAAPELLSGRANEWDVRSDVYALGAILYRALTGTYVLDPALPLAEIAARTGRSAVRPSALDRRLNREIDAIVARCLAAEKALRYGSVAELAADVRRHLQGRTVLAHPPSVGYRVSKFLRQHRPLVFTAGLVSLALIVASVVSTAAYWRAARDRAQAEAAQQAAEQNAEVSFVIGEFLREMFESAGRSGRVTGGALTVRELLDRAGERIDREPIKPAADASLRMMIANSYRELGLDRQAEPHYRKALALRSELFGPEAADTADCLDALARCLRALGRVAEAEPLVERAWAIRLRTLPPTSGYFATSANSLGLIKRSLGKLDEAERWYLEALERYRVAFGPKNESVPVVMVNLAVLQSTRGALDLAERTLREALALDHEIHGDAPHADTAGAYGNLADVLARQPQRAEEAERCFQLALEQYRALFGDHHTRIGMTLERYGRFLLTEGRIAEAEAMLAQAAVMLEQLQRWDEALAAWGGLAAVRSATGDRANSLQLFGRGSALLDDCRVANPAVAAAFRVEHARALLADERRAPAEQELRAAEAIAAESPAARTSRAEARTLLEAHFGTPAP